MPADMPNHAVLILGAGPGGLSTALHLAKIAPHLVPRILVLEKAHHPRPKLCAGGLVIDAEVILERLGLNVNEVPHVIASTAHFDFAGRGLKIGTPGRRTLRIVRRDEFDAWLASKTLESGIEIREGVTVKNVVPDAEGVTVETEAGTFHALVAVGADGSNGVTRRCVLPEAPVFTARALEVLIPVNARESPSHISSPKGNGKHRENDAYFDFFPIPDNIAGYVWDFPTRVKGQPMRCWGIYDTNILANENRPPLKEPLAAEMERHGFDLNQHEIKGHPIRWFDPFSPFSVPRVLLVGDAAGADPIFGEGISMALGYGLVAAREIGESFRRREFSFRGYRWHVLRSPLGQTLIARWVIANIIYALKWRWFQILLWRVLKPFVVLVAWLLVLNWGRRLKAGKP
jgi:flavin-dependent dehydrogenase